MSKHLHAATGLIALVFVATLGVGVNMSRASDPDPSMLLLQATNTKLISEKIAVSLARDLIEEVYGKDELKTQEPLKALDGGETWIIEGNRKFGDKPTAENLPDYGKVELVVSKSDCRILKFTWEFMLSPPR